MKQLNVNVTPEFEKDLARFMSARKIKTKSEALRVALKEVASKEKPDYRRLIGAALVGPENPNPRFTKPEELW